MRASTVRRSAPAGLALLALGAVAVAVPTISATASQPPAPKVVAAASATNGKIAYSCLNHGGSGLNGWVVAAGNGSGKTFEPWSWGAFRGSAQWSADGSELVHSASFPDALAGTPLAAKEHGPLLLTNGSLSTPDPRVLKDIARVLKPTSRQVFVLGGTGSISQGIENTLRAAGYTVTRLAGSDRYETALQIATFLGTGASAPHYILLATGSDFPDGLAAGAAAARFWAFASDGGGAVLLTAGARLPAGVQSYVNGAGAARPGGVVVVTVGGLAAQAYPTADASYVGADRYQTSELVAEHVFLSVPHRVALATGSSFPDALSGGVYAGVSNAPLLLAPPSLTTTGAVPSYLHAWSSGIDTGYIFGGIGVVSDTVETDLGKIIGHDVTHTRITG